MNTTTAPLTDAQLADALDAIHTALEAVRLTDTYAWHRAIRTSTLPAQARHFALTLATHFGPRATIAAKWTPSQETLAKEMGGSGKSTHGVIKATRTLVDTGYLATTKAGRQTLYFATVPADRATEFGAEPQTWAEATTAPTTTPATTPITGGAHTDTPGTAHTDWAPTPVSLHMHSPSGNNTLPIPTTGAATTDAWGLPAATAGPVEGGEGIRQPSTVLAALGPDRFARYGVLLNEVSLRLPADHAEGVWGALTKTSPARVWFAEQVMTIVDAGHRDDVVAEMTRSYDNTRDYGRVLTTRLKALTSELRARHGDLRPQADPQTTGGAGSRTFDPDPALTARIVTALKRPDYGTTPLPIS